MSASHTASLEEREGWGGEGESHSSYHSHQHAPPFMQLPLTSPSPYATPTHLFFWQMKRCCESAPRKVSSSSISTAIMYDGVIVVSMAI